MSSAFDRPLPPKKEVFLMLLEGPSVFIHLDPRKETVAVPPWFKREPRLILQVGRNMAVPIPDLDVNDTGLSCTLSFSRSPHKVLVPWTSVYALIGEDGRGMLWPQDVPAEVAGEYGVAQKPAPPKEETPVEATDGAPAKKPRKRKPKAKSDEAKAAKPAPRRDRPAPVAAPAPGPRPEIAPPPQASRAATASASPATRKPKRELPSYLRVIK